LPERTRLAADQCQHPRAVRRQRTCAARGRRHADGRNALHQRHAEQQCEIGASGMAIETGRTDGDSWGPASSVGATATMVAASRAVASPGPEALLDDPWADPLVREVGLAPFIGILDGEINFDDDPLLNRKTATEQ